LPDAEINDDRKTEVDNSSSVFRTNEVKHHLRYLATGLLLALTLACNAGTSKSTSNSSNRSGNAKVTTANRVANADVWIDTIAMARENEGKPGEFTDIFTPGDRTIYCVIKLNQAKNETAVKFVWKAIVGEGAQNSYAYNGKDSMTIDYTTTPDTKFVFSHVTYPDDWPRGSYRVEVYINGALDKTIDYTIE